MSKKRPSYRELKERIRELEKEILRTKNIAVEFLEKRNILKEQNIKLVKKSIELSEIKRELEDKNYELESTRAELQQQNVDLIRKSIDLSDIMRQLEDKNYNLTLSRAELGKTLAALQESEERYRLVAENALVGIVIADKQENLAFSNPAFAEMLGYSRDELVQINFSQLTDRDEFNKLREQTKLREKGLSNCYESKMRHKNGKFRDVLISASPIKEANGSYKASLTIIADITERKQAEEKVKDALREKEVLLKEIHHRVKNNMQIISSLLNLQEMNVKDRAVQRIFRESQNRIRSMSLIHEKMYQSEDLAKFNIRRYIESFTNDLFITYDVSPQAISLENNVDDIHLKPDTAIPCCMLINELVSNSLKHAFPPGEYDTAEPRIQVTMSTNKGNEHMLVVRDNGVGFPEGFDYRKTETLGFQLVPMFVKKLRGTMGIGSRGGAEIRIRFKA